MYTTSRYASKDTRALAGAMAKKCGERYVARGKKTIAGLATDARKLGDATVSVIEEKKGKAERISVIEVDELGRWRFKEERLLNSTEK
ncbi:MAG: hypothetical protein V1861_01085 [Candidatus Micrarchaeota archaeon]